MAPSHVGRHSSSIPAYLTTFVGRRYELTQVKALLATDRLVTLTGVGGVGKTRLAHRAADDLGRNFPDGVWLVNLAGLQDPKLLVHAVAAAMGLRDEAGRWDLSVLVDHLRDEQLLIVLDNCEHLLDACASLAATVLSETRGVRILATSRESLAITGERIVQVPPLALPGRDSPPPPLRALAQYDSVRLFADRAACVLPGFAVREDNRVAVTEVCWQLEGIPLAIELAVARLRALSVEELRDGLRDRYRLLATGWRDLPARQRTLRALVDWSFDLCSPQGQAVWARSSVFRGGFELEAAEAVCSGADRVTDAVFESLSRLIDQSILLREEPRGRTRYRMLETLREYGWSRLAESGETDVIQQRHRDWCQHLVEQADEGTFGPEQKIWFTRLRLDHANLRAAMECCLADPDQTEAVLGMAAGLCYYWLNTGFLSEGRRWLDRGLALDPRPSRARAKALWVDAWLAILQGELAAARPLLKQCHDLSQSLGDKVSEAWVTQLTAYGAMGAGDLDQAAALYQQALAQHRAVADESGIVLTLLRMAILAALTDDIEAGIAFCREGITLCDLHEERFLKSGVLWVLGILHWRRGDVAGAVSAVTDSIRHVVSFGDPMALARAVEALAWTAATDGATDESATLFGASDKLWRSFGGGLFAYMRGYHDKCEAEVRSSLSPPAYRAAFDRGARMTYNELLAHVLGEEGTPTPTVRDAFEDPLTPREREIVGLIAQGMSNKQIAARLVIAQRTAEAHVEHILTKLGFSSRTQIAAWAIDHRWGTKSS